MVKKQAEFLTDEAWAAFRQEFDSADDRSCAILCGSYIDNCLEVLIVESLAHPEMVKRELFAEMGPLGTFSAKIKLAHALNIIDEMMFKDMNLVRKIRNEFAHRLHGLSFDVDPIRSWCRDLLFPEDWCDGYDDDINIYCGKDPRKRFIFTCSMTLTYFEMNFHYKAQAIRKAILSVPELVPRPLP